MTTDIGFEKRFFLNENFLFFAFCLTFSRRISGSLLFAQKTDHFLIPRWIIKHYIPKQQICSHGSPPH